MNNYCKNCKTRTKKGTCYNYCSKLRKIIDKAMDCKNCDELEPRIYKGFKKYTLKEKSTLKNGKMKTKSNRLAKLERNRKSVFTNNMDKCYLCSNKRTDIHEIFRGRNRKNSMIYGFVLPLCRECHSTKAEAINFEEFWHRQAQLYFEKYIGSREEFLRVFRRNYIIKKEETDD